MHIHVQFTKRFYFAQNAFFEFLLRDVPRQHLTDRQRKDSYYPPHSTHSNGQKIATCSNFSHCQSGQGLLMMLVLPMLFAFMKPSSTGACCPFAENVARHPMMFGGQGKSQVASSAVARQVRTHYSKGVSMCPHEKCIVFWLALQVLTSQPRLCKIHLGAEEVYPFSVD